MSPPKPPSLPIDNEPPKPYEVLTTQGSKALAEQDYVTAEYCFKTAVIELEKLGSTDENGLITIGLLNLANLYKIQEKYKEAEPLLSRTLNLLLNLKGVNHPAFLYALKQLTELYELEGDLSAAENLYQWALEIFENKLTPDHPLLLLPLKSLVAFYERHNQEAEAAHLTQRIETIESNEAHWKFYLDEGSRAYFSGDITLAEELFQKSLLILDFLPQYADSNELALILHNLASVYKKQGNLHDALIHGLRALEIYDKHHKKDDPALSAPLTNLLEIYQALDEKKEVKRYADRIKKLKKRK